MGIFIQTLFSNPDIFLMQVLVVVFSVCCHEYAHAWMALKQGDHTAATLGHLTLNPLKQMGGFSIIMLLLIGLAWGTTPVNPELMRKKYSHALVSFAGPATNIILFVVFCVIFSLLFQFKANPSALILFRLGALINFVLFIINMLPVPGFDGWHVYAYFFPRIERASSELIKGAFLLSFFLVFAFVDYLYAAAEYCSIMLSSAMVSLLRIITGGS